MIQKASTGQKSLAHDRLANQFDDLMNEYDFTRRLEVLVDGFLGSVELPGKLILEAGCGTGRISEQLSQRGAHVVSVDIGYNLVVRTGNRCPCRPAVASVLDLPFPDNSFDIVVSSEVIEHTPRPLDAVREMYRIVKPAGHLVLTTPNWLWQFPVRLSSALKLRPYDGLENFVKPSQLRQTVEAVGGHVLQHSGIHLFPFQLGALNPINRRIDEFGNILLPLMINQCLHCVKASL